MYRIRLHGRVGQGLKTAGRILGTAFFLQGREVQDAPRHGAECLGAPIFAYVRASKEVIYEQGVIGTPDLVAVVDETLIQIPAVGVLAGAVKRTVMIVASAENSEVWKKRPILALAPCPTGWGCDPKDTVEVGGLAVKTGIWPLKEYSGGKVTHTHIPPSRVPFEEYLKTQGRFDHLFQPERNEALLAEIQEAVDVYWASMG